MSIRMRHTRGHTGNRRSHHALKETTIVKDTASGNMRLPHRLDEVTGMYRGKQIAPPSGEKKKKELRAKTKEPSGTHHEHVHEPAAPETTGSKGLLGKLTGKAKPKSRSGMGGGA